MTNGKGIGTQTSLRFCCEQRIFQRQAQDRKNRELLESSIGFFHKGYLHKKIVFYLKKKGEWRKNG